MLRITRSTFSIRIFRHFVNNTADVPMCTSSSSLPSTGVEKIVRDPNMVDLGLSNVVSNGKGVKKECCF